MSSPRSSRWYGVVAFIGAVAIPLFLTIGPTAIHDPVLLATTLSGVELIYLSILLSTVLLLHSDLAAKMKGLVPAESIAEAEFYDRFSEALRAAKTRVRLSYMSNRSPLQSRNPVMKDYYERLPSEIRKRQSVEFKRLMRAAPGVGDWLEQMVRELKDAANFSLACIPGTDPKVENVPIVAVQCVDEDEVFFVAVGEQQESRDPRDLYVESEEFNRIWTQYYDRLWNAALLVIDRGRINDSNLAKVRQLVKG